MSKNSKNARIPDNIIRRIHKLNTEEFVYSENDEILFRLNFVNRFQADDKGSIGIEMGPIGIKTDREFIGIGGFYYKPKYFGGINVQIFLESWDWFLKKTKVEKKAFETALEATSVMTFVFGGIDEGLLFYLFGLVSDLYALQSTGVNLEQKISEIGTKIRQHVKKYLRLEYQKNIKAFSKIEALKVFLKNVSAESVLARYAKLHDFDVKLGKHPDLTIDSISFEVKSRLSPQFIGNDIPEKLLRDYKSELQKKPLSLTNPIVRGLKQKAEVVAIQVSDLQKRTISKYSTKWFSTESLLSSLKKIISFKGTMKRKRVLLFTINPNGFFGRIILVK